MQPKGLSWDFGIGVSFIYFMLMTRNFIKGPNLDLDNSYFILLSHWFKKQVTREVFSPHRPDLPAIRQLVTGDG